MKKPEDFNMMLSVTVISFTTLVCIFASIGYWVSSFSSYLSFIFVSLTALLWLNWYHSIFPIIKSPISPKSSSYSVYSQVLRYRVCPFGIFMKECPFISSCQLLKAINLWSESFSDRLLCFFVPLLLQRFLNLIYLSIWLGPFHARLSRLCCQSESMKSYL